MSRRRPFAVRWWSQEWVEYQGTSFGTAEAAERKARQMHDDGYGAVSWWERNERGEVVGSIHVIRSSEAPE